MNALANVDITAALASGSTSREGAPGSSRIVRKWQRQVKIICALKRFGKNYRTKSFQYGIAPCLTAASPSLISKDLYEKINTSEGSSARNLSTGVPFNPNSPLQHAPKKKFTLLPASQKKNGEGLSSRMSDVFTDCRALSQLLLLLTMVSVKAFKENDLLEKPIVGLFIVTVIVLDSRKEGTTATYKPVGQIVLVSLLLLLWVSSGANAQGDSADGPPGSPNEREELPDEVEAAVSTVVVAIFAIVIGAGWIKINRRPLVSDTPATVAIPLAPLADPLLVALQDELRPEPEPLEEQRQPLVLQDEQVRAEFIDVIAVLNENRDAARRSDPSFYIRPAVDGFAGPVQRGLQ